MSQVRTVSYQCISDPKPTVILVEGEVECPNCGAEIELGTTCCAYCQTPVAAMGLE